MTVRVRPWTKRGKSGWEVDISFLWPDGTRYRERKKAPVTSESAARRWGQQRETHLMSEGKSALESEPEPTVQPEPSPVPTLDEFAPSFIRGHAKAKQQKQSGIDAKESILKHHLVPALGHKRLDEITDEDVALLLATFAEGIPDGHGGFRIKLTAKVKTINNRLTVLAKLLRVAVEWKKIPAMPCTVKLLKVPEEELTFYEQDIYDRLVDAAAKVDPRAHVIVLLGGDAGLRRGEIIGLFQTDVDFARHQLTVQRSSYQGKLGPTKSKKNRTVPMTKALEAALKALRHLRGERVLHRDDGTPLTPKKIRMWMQQVERRAGLPQTGAVHILRHSFCSHLAMRGAPARVIQELAGHTELSTTLRYMHLAKGAKHAAIELLDAARNELPNVAPVESTEGGSRPS